MTGPWTADEAMRPTTDPAWVMAAEGFDPLRQSSLGTRFAISNGFLGARCEREMPRGARDAGPARTYVAGLFDKSDAAGDTTRLIPAPGWFAFHIRLPTGPLVHHPGDLSSHLTILDEKRGVLLTDLRHARSPDIALRLRTLRLLSLSERAIGLQLIEIDIENGEIDLSFEASLEGLEDGLVCERLAADLGVWHTAHSGKRVAMASAVSLRIDGEDHPPAMSGAAGWSWTWRCRPGQTIRFERIVATIRSDRHGPDPAAEALRRLGAASHLGARRVLADHQWAWAARWRSSDIQVGGDAAAQRALRFAIYHLNSAADPDDPQVSIAARALTGSDYRGHVFWDTEIFLLPFYTLTWPEAARTLLMYRHRTLDAAREKAARMGFRGAFYAWESADTGQDETPKYVIAPDRQVVDVVCGDQEQHISADIAYAVWQYWLATGDETFLLDAGAEILLETARFWSSRARLEADGKCHIRGVMGPDEYHTNVDDNAFTNVMARWNIRRALDAAALLRTRWPDRWTSLSDRLKLHDEELADWARTAAAMAVALRPGSDVLEQFTGFSELNEVHLADYAGRSVPMDVVLGRDRTQRSQVIKQADVVALLALLPEEFTDASAAANFHFYAPRCSHGSSLSPALHGVVAARLGDDALALHYFRQAAAIDLKDSHVAIDGGVHIAALGGLWLAAVHGFAGLALRANGLALDPKLPAEWPSLAFGIQWRGRRLRIRIVRAPHLIEAILEAGEAMTLFVQGEAYDVSRDRVLSVTPIAACGSRVSPPD